MGFNVCPNLLCSWDDNAHNNSLQLRTNRDNRNNGYNNRNNRNNNGNNRNNNRVRCNTRSHRINQLHEDGTYSRGTQDCNQQSAWRVLSQLPLCLNLFQFIKFFKFKFKFVKFFKLTKSFRATICVLVLCILFLSVIAIIFIIFVLIFIFIFLIFIFLIFVLTKSFRAGIYVLILLFSVIAIIFILFLLIFVFLIFILILLFIFTKHQQLRTTAVLLWVKPKLKSKLWNAGMELATEFGSLQHGMAGSCFFNI